MSQSPAASSASGDSRLEATLDKLQHDSVAYFLHEVNESNGLVTDQSRQC